MHITVSSPVYLESYYENIPDTDSRWNGNVASSLRAVALKISALPKDVVDVEIEKNDEIGTVADAVGFMGFSYPSSAKTDYYYIDLSFKDSDNYDSIGSLLKTLADYISETKDFELSKCVIIEDEPAQLLRAYFVKKPL